MLSSLGSFSVDESKALGHREFTPQTPCFLGYAILLNPKGEMLVIFNPLS